MTRLLIIISNTYTTSIGILKKYDKYLGNEYYLIISSKKG